MSNATNVASHSGLQVPPGPPGHLLFGSMPELSRDWLGFMARAVQTYGSVVRFRMPWPLREIVLVTDPDMVERIFVSDAAKFRKSLPQRMIEPIVGQGLLLAEGDGWKRRRLMLNPAFHRRRVAVYADDMASCAEAMLETWRKAPVRDVYADAVEFTLRVSARTMFGISMGSDVARAHTALADVMTSFDAYLKSRLPLPLTIPTPNGLRLRRAARELEAVVYRFIGERARSGEDRDDLLAMLRDARDENGRPLTAREIRDEAVTAFLAGSETSAVALGWTLYLLATHPSVAAAVRSEVRDVLGTARINAENMRRLKYTEAVVKESLRLYPPAWRFAREAVEDYGLGDFIVRRGTQVYTSPYLLHRSGAYFEEPERFAPERWTQSDTRPLPRFAYFPFSGGQRMCIGSAFAMMELVIALAIVLPTTTLELIERPQLRPSFTLRPRDGIFVRAHVA